MNCHEFENRLHCLLDDRQDPAADRLLCTHARGCRACSQLLAGQEAVLSGLAAMAVPLMAEEFSRQVVGKTAKIPAAQPNPAGPMRPMSRVWLAAATLLASAATVLLAIATVWYARGGASNASVSSDSSTSGADIGGADLVRAEAPESRRTHRGGGGLAMTHSSLLIEAPRLPQHVRGSYRGAIDNLAVALPETVEQLHDVERLAPGIRPIRITFSMLWDALCEVIPGYRDRSQQPQAAGAT